MKVAIIVKKFPVISETFILNHINSLIDAGIGVQVFAYEKNQLQAIQPQYLKNDLNKLTTYGAINPLSKSSRLTSLCKLIFQNIFKDKNLNILKSLNFIKYGRNALNLDLFFKAQIFRQIQRFDIIHCHFGPIAEDIRILHELGLVKGKFVVSFHGYDFRTKAILDQYKNYKKVFGVFDGVVANSFYTREELIKVGCPREKVVVLPVLPSLETISPKSLFPQREIICPFRILTVARLEEVKGVRYGVEAIAILKAKYRVQVHYDIIGGGSLLGEIQQLIDFSNVQDEVSLHGPKTQDQIVPFYQQADVFLLTSLMETQGLVLLEAQLNSLPVVATHTGGIPESMLENETGFLVEVQNPDQIAEALYKLYIDPDLRKSFSAAGGRFVKEKFNPEKITDKMISFYKSLLGRP